MKSSKLVNVFIVVLLANNCLVQAMRQVVPRVAPRAMAIAAPVILGGAARYLAQTPGSFAAKTQKPEVEVIKFPAVTYRADLGTDRKFEEAVFAANQSAQRVKDLFEEGYIPTWHKMKTELIPEIVKNDEQIRLWKTFFKSPHGSRVATLQEFQEAVLREGFKDFLDQSKSKITEKMRAANQAKLQSPQPVTVDRNVNGVVDKIRTYKAPGHEDIVIQDEMPKEFFEVTGKYLQDYNQAMDAFNKYLRGSYDGYEVRHQLKIHEEDENWSKDKFKQVCQGFKKSNPELLSKLESYEKNLQNFQKSLPEGSVFKNMSMSDLKLYSPSKIEKMISLQYQVDSYLDNGFEQGKHFLEIKNPYVVLSISQNISKADFEQRFKTHSYFYKQIKGAIKELKDLVFVTPKMQEYFGHYAGEQPGMKSLQTIEAFSNQCWSKMGDACGIIRKNFEYEDAFQKGKFEKVDLNNADPVKAFGVKNTFVEEVVYLIKNIATISSEAKNAIVDVFERMSPHHYSRFATDKLSGIEQLKNFITVKGINDWQHRLRSVRDKVNASYIYLKYKKYMNNSEELKKLDDVYKKAEQQLKEEQKKLNMFTVFLIGAGLVAGVKVTVDQLKKLIHMVMTGAVDTFSDIFTNLSELEKNKSIFPYEQGLEGDQVNQIEKKDTQFDWPQVDSDVQPSGEYVSLEDQDKLREQHEQALQQGADVADYFDRQQWQQLEENQAITIVETLPYLSPAAMKKRMDQVINYFRNMDMKQWPNHAREFLSQLMQMIRTQMSNLRQFSGRKLSQVDEQRMKLYNWFYAQMKKDQEIVDDFLKTAEKKAA